MSGIMAVGKWQRCVATFLYEGSRKSLDYISCILDVEGLNASVAWTPAAARSCSCQPVKTTVMFIRPGSAKLLQSLLSEARCEFAVVSNMAAKNCIPCTERLLRHATTGDRALEKHVTVPLLGVPGLPSVRSVTGMTSERSAFGDPS